MLLFICNCGCTMPDEQQQYETVTTTTTTQSNLHTLLSVQKLIFWGDAWQMYPPGRGIWWSNAVLCKVSLTFTVMHKVSLTFWGAAMRRCRCTPSRGIWWPRAVLCKVILTCKSQTQNEFKIADGDVPPSIGIWWSGSVLRKVNYILQNTIETWNMNCWTFRNLCRLMCFVIVVLLLVTAECCWSSCSSVIVDQQLQLNKNNNKITQ